MLLKKKVKEEVSKDLIERSYDLIIIYIGYMILLLGMLNIIVKVPNEFLFGATLAGWFFALSDYFLLTKKKFYESDFTINNFFLFSGVFSFFLLPVILMSFPSFYSKIKPFADLVTFLALGIVIVGIGYKSNQLKRKFIDDMKKESVDLRQIFDDQYKIIEKTQNKINEMEKRCSEYEKEVLELNDKLKSYEDGKS